MSQLLAWILTMLLFWLSSCLSLPNQKGSWLLRPFINLAHSYFEIWINSTSWKEGNVSTMGQLTKLFLTWSNSKFKSTTGWTQLIFSCCKYLKWRNSMDIKLLSPAKLSRTNILFRKIALFKIHKIVSWSKQWLLKKSNRTVSSLSLCLIEALRTSIAYLQINSIS